VSTSVVVFGVPKGNPDNIQDWDDLVEPGVEIVTPNPASSGAARWNALAAYGQVIANGGTEAEAEEYLTDFFANVVALPGSGRDATTAFINGTGNVLMAYENEAILAAQNGQGFDYIIPETTLLIENPGAVLVDATPKATEWLDYVLSSGGQTQFALKGFRPLEGVDVDVDEVEGAKDPKNPYPPIGTLLTVEKDFESWSALSKKFFDEQNGIVTKIIAASGKAS
jgi:sulfate transport system substrate-binding protein